ncbi:MAG: tetratricopeptide repeat protein [Anaerolineae bacterium]|nr:tetratricopeptide repeat protein [Anaerolineae bacterium]
MAKRKQRSKQPAPRASTRIPPSLMLQDLDEVTRLRENQQYREADMLLNQLHFRYSNRFEIFAEMAALAQETNNAVKLQYACRRMLELQPKDPESTLGLAHAYLQQDYRALAQRTFQEFLRLAPKHPQADKVREILSLIENIVQPESENISAEDVFNLALNHEMVQVLLSEGNYSQAERLCRSVLRQVPDYIPLLNNLSLIYRLQGKLTLAMRTAQRVLELEPDNIHALANQIQYLCLSGRHEEARTYAEPLKNSTRPAWEGWLRKAEAALLLEDHEGALETYRLYHETKTKGAMLPAAEATLAHFAAVAAATLGDVTEARLLWQEALQLQPGYDLAHQNLMDLDFPRSQRNGAWAFDKSFWFHESMLQALIKTLQSSLGNSSEDLKRVQRKTHQMLQQHPEFNSIAANVLAIGDFETRNFILILAGMAQDPTLLDAVKAFALGKQGTDITRLRALQAAVEAQLISDDEVPMWLDGEWHTITPTRIRVITEPSTCHTPQVVALLDEALEAQKEQDWKHAEALFAQASTLEPEAADLQGNRAVMVVYQGRSQEAEAMLEEVQQRFPDYAYARINLAHSALAKSNNKRARELITPLFSAPQLHLLEFRSLCGITINLAMAEKDLILLERWLSLLEFYVPDDPELEKYYGWMDELLTPPPPTFLPPKVQRRKSGA